MERDLDIAGHRFTIHELNDVYDSITGRPLTGSWLWDSAVILSQWIATCGHLDFPLQGKAVLELGAGAGLPGLTAALLGASRVVLTDVGPILPGLKKNVEVNGVGDRVEVRELVWGSAEVAQHELGKFDLVLMSDVLFDAAEMATLAQTLGAVCREGTRVWAASEVRPWTEECLSELVREGFEVYELSVPSGLSSLPSSVSLEGGESPDTFAIYSLVPPANSNCSGGDCP